MNKLAISIVVALTTVLAACGSDSTPSSSSGAAAAGAAVTVKSNEFVPAQVTVKVGEEVTWTWAGGNHNVVSGPNCTGDAKFTSGSPTPTVGNTFKQKFDTAGTFEYFCMPHCGAGMKGTVVVR